MLNAIRSLLEADPYTPFTLSLTSRTTIRIARPETATINETGDILHVIDEDSRENYISIRHVVCLTPDLPPDFPMEVPF